MKHNACYKKYVGEFEAASLFHGKINANIQNKTYLTVCTNGFSGSVCLEW